MKDSTLSDLEELESQAKAARRGFEPSWFLNLSFYAGKQWHYFAAGQLREPRLDNHRVMFTDNRILGIIRTEIAKLTKNRPAFTATPQTGENEDVDAAQLSERVLDYLWLEHRLAARQRAALLWARVCAAGFWKLYWDSAAGDSVEVLAGPDNRALLGQDGRPVRADALGGAVPEGLKVKKVAKGEVCVEVRSPFELLPDPLAEEGGLDDCEWLIEESVRSVDYVKERYDTELQPDADAVAGVAESRMPAFGQNREESGSGSYKGVRIREYWHRRSSQHPNGRRAVWAGDQLLAEEDNPYGDLPYVMFKGLEVPGRFWPTSTVEQLRGPQAELNKTRSQIRENAARFGNPSLLKARTANVRHTGVPGEEVLFDATLGPDSIPRYLQPPEMPAYVQTELDRMSESFREISGQHEVTQGQVPAGITAASAINLLQEQDETRLSPDVAELEHTLALAGSKLLDLVARYYTDERTMKLAGEDGAWDIFEFRGAMLKGNTHVEVQAGSALPRSKAAKQAAMTETLNLVLQYGLDVKPRDLRKFLRDYEVGGLESLFSDLTETERQVNRENYRLARGDQVNINSYDDDEVHLEGHEEYQRSARYERMDDGIRALFEAHVEEHRARFTEQQEAAAASQDPFGVTNLPPEMGGAPAAPSGGTGQNGGVSSPSTAGGNQA